ncbi:hypothetical protein [Natrinema altunense]|uniref:Uncharacterized protein n=1 Tax=Natrinema altunense TaxID=222984 RepID=A0A482XXJ1_9EURY|nr:hypothetical protein [Natrinema altunense]RZH67200.1 hypothetical protein ELS17_15765 [Natrinema altunense]
MTNDAASGGGGPASERAADDEGVLPPCPQCGEPMVATRVDGPMEAYATPCGCRVWPDALSRTDDE